MKFRLGFLLLLMQWGALFAQPSLMEFSRPDLRWHTLETPHFRIHFHADKEGKGSNRTAQVVAEIAEDIYVPITSLYQHEPDTKVEFVLKDFEDYSNGAAYFFDNKIEIWAPALETPLRGEHEWLRNVITHEFTHIIQVQKTMRLSRKLPIFYFQYLGYEPVRRPDILYGYPNIIASYPVPIMNNPAWFAEGTAQYQRAGLHYDTWDTHRDMLLRTQMLADKAFTLAEMGSFLSKTSLGRESVYNHGFAFTRYLAKRFGEPVLRQISEALARHWNMDNALRDVTGIGGAKLQAEWVAEMKAAYQTQTAAIRSQEVKGERMESEGFFNFYPRFSPDGTRVAYLSNRGYDFSATSLYIKDLGEKLNAKSDKAEVVIPLEGASLQAFEVLCSHGKPLKTGIAAAFSWHPNGQEIAVSRIQDTKQGHRYSDLYLLDLKTKKLNRLTQGLRAAAPQFSPDGKSLAFIQQQDGVTNLMRFDLATKTVKPLTSFTGGVQVTDAHWANDWIYFTKVAHGASDIFRVKNDGTGLMAVLASPADERAPFWTKEALYFSSDQSGIFNLYRKVHATEQIEGLTNEIGGAFQPNVKANGEVVFAEYEAGGYKIARLTRPSAVLVSPYQAPENLAKPALSQVSAESPSMDWAALNQADDRHTLPLSKEALRSKQTTNPEVNVKPYEPSYTKLSFIPIFRVDDYNSPARGLDADLQASQTSSAWASSKLGMMVSSREIVDGFNLYASLLFAPASVEANTIRDFFVPSRFRKLERDLQLLLEYTKGFSFIPKKWSPQLVFEAYNIQRRVKSGLTIEEFPCTACYPENSYADLTYTLWDFTLNAKSKLSRNAALSVGYKVSPFSVRTESFYSREYRQTISASVAKYYIGHGVVAQADLEYLKPSRYDHLLPEGLQVRFNAEFLPSRLLDRYEIQNGFLEPVYKSYPIRRLAFDAKYGQALGQIQGYPHGFSVRLKGSSILGGTVDDFFNEYTGGVIGARGYPFYAIGGNEAAWAQVAYSFPLYTQFKRQWGWVTPDKLYARLYADVTTAWTGAFEGASSIRKDLGAELRLSLGSFYIFPTALFVSGTYGFDRFDVTLRNRLTTADGKRTVSYGKELLWHFGLLFNFDL